MTKTAPASKAKPKTKRPATSKTDDAINSALSAIVKDKPARATAKRPAAKGAKRPSANTAKVRARPAKETAAEPSSMASALSGFSGVAGQLISWADKLSEMAGPVASMSMALATSQLKGPGSKVAIKAAGAMLRQTREALGMTAQEVGQAINLQDAALLEQAETGAAALPFEVVLRLAGVLGRHDPISFALKLTRSYNPELWAAMDALGIGKLAVQAGRERELANIYRRRDAARKLSDKEFAALLALVGAAFDMGLEFHGK